MACKDIVVTIFDFNIVDTYTVMIKRIDNSINDGSIIPSYTQVATGGQVLFKGLPDGEYIAGIQRTCIAGGQSNFIWSDIVGVNCVSPQAMAVGGITGVAANVSWTDEPGFTFTVYVDDGLAQAPTGAGVFTMAGLMTGSVYKVGVKKRCKTSEYSPRIVKTFATVVAVPTFTVRVIRKECTGSNFDGYMLRFSLTGGLDVVGKQYRISFTEFDGTLNLLKTYTVGVGDTLTTMIMKLSGDLAGTNLIIGSNFASFDMLSKEQKAANGVIINCQDINLLTGYSVAIV